MKRFSIYISVLLILATVFYALTVISQANVCSSVRSYYCQKLQQQAPSSSTDTGAIK